MHTNRRGRLLIGFISLLSNPFLKMKYCVNIKVHYLAGVVHTGTGRITWCNYTYNIQELWNAQFAL